MSDKISSIAEKEQKRAQKAYKIVQKIGENEIKEFKSAVDKFPSMIINCGLLQALTFYSSKDHLKKAFESLKDWLCKYYNWSSNEDIIEKIIGMNAFEYRQITRESLSFLTWLKRFAEEKYQKIK